MFSVPTSGHQVVLGTRVRRLHRERPETSTYFENILKDVRLNGCAEASIKRIDALVTQRGSEVRLDELRQRRVPENREGHVGKSCRLRFRFHRHEDDALRKRRIDGILEAADSVSRVECKPVSACFAREMKRR